MKRLSLIALGFLALTSTVSAATFRGGDDLVTLSAPVTDDLYAAGKRVEITQKVTGDLTVFGSKVIVTAPIGQSINAAGGTLEIVSTVGRTVRIAGGTVTVRGKIGGDLLVAGGDVTIGKDAIVTGDVHVVGGKLLVRGIVGGDLQVNGGDVRFEGIAHGDASLRGEQVTMAGSVEGNTVLVAKSLTIESGASFKGPVAFWTPSSTADFGNSLASGQEATYQSNLRTIEGEPSEDASPLRSALSLFSILSGALVLFLLSFATRTFFVDAAKDLQRRPWKCFFSGLLFLVVTPPIFVLLLITVIGVPLALLLLAGYLSTLFFSAPLASLVLARWGEMRAKKKWGKWTIFGMSLLVFIVLRLLSIIPILGWIVKGVLILLSVGALLLTKAAKWKKIA